MNDAAGRNETLLQLAKQTINLVTESKSAATNKKYGHAFDLWEQFIQSQGQPSLPALPAHVACYITFLINSEVGISAVNAAVYSIKYYHKLNGLEDPTENELNKNLLEVARRRLTKPVVKKDPAQSEDIFKLLKKNIENKNLKVLRDCTMIALGFFGFLRYNELVNLKVEDIIFFTDRMSINVRRSKTDQAGHGAHTDVARLPGLTCPVAIVERYLQEADLTSEKEKNLI